MNWFQRLPRSSHTVHLPQSPFISPTIARYASRQTTNKVKERISAVTPFPTSQGTGHQLVELYVSPGATTIKSLKTYALVFFGCTIGFAPYIYAKGEDVRGAAFLAAFASFMPVCMMHVVTRNVVSRLWLVTDTQGRLPQAIRHYFFQSGSPPSASGTHPRFPQQPVAIEVFNIWGRSKVYTVKLDQLYVAGTRRGYDVLETRGAKDINRISLPLSFYIREGMDKTVPALKAFKNQLGML
ncbi:hypothetical protein IWQ62_005843 [Dispira parvispora]|uniref:Uncharacterized protein n=1 Tax=Dispira parvispora TaxID=1520584 RepID=A0A9W8AM02_9FUNG|nr:hypothetical protein IWQ62_005843 [Dispira parvispora]